MSNQSQKPISKKPEILDISTTNYNEIKYLIFNKSRENLFIFQFFFFFFHSESKEIANSLFERKLH